MLLTLVGPRRPSWLISRLATRVARAGDLGWPVCRPLRRRQVLRRAVGFVPRSSNAAERDEPSGSWLPRSKPEFPRDESAVSRWRFGGAETEIGLPSAGVGQPWQVEAAAAVRNLSILLPLAKHTSWLCKRKTCRAAIVIGRGNSHRSPCLLTGCHGALSVRLRSSAASSSQHAIDACPQHDGA